MRRSLAFATATVFVFAMSVTASAEASTARFGPAQNVRRITHALVVTSNWAGYAAQNIRHHFESVEASWQQPTPSCGGGTSYSSFWVGLDGYGSHSIEQIGTDSDCANGTATYYA